MTKRLLLSLTSLAFLQLILLGWTSWPTSETKSDLRPVLALSANEISEVHITGVGIDGSPKAPVHLIKEPGGKWAISSLDGFPARPDRVADLIKQLTGLKVRAPISSDPKQHDSLGVASTRYSRKISLYSEGNKATFFVGQGKGNSIHIRVDGSNDVFLTHGTTAWRLSADDGDYVERLYFAFDPSQLRSLRVSSPYGQYELILKDGIFSSPQALPGQTLNQDALTQLVRKLSKIVTRQPLGANMRPEYGISNGTVITLSLEEDSGLTVRSISVGKPVDALVPVKAHDDAFYILTSFSKVRGFLDSQITNFVAGAPPPP